VKNERGFTLVEVMVALTILAIVLTSVFAPMQFALGTAADSEREIVATEAAKTLFDELGQTIPSTYGEREGNLPTGQHWRLLVSPVRERSPLRQAGLPEGHRATLSLSWLQRGRRVALVFETIFLAVEK
jgi:prepilin-type N-terminal cleavage/methylation domain-containing protein